MNGRVLRGDRVAKERAVAGVHAHALGEVPRSVGVPSLGQPIPGQAGLFVVHHVKVVVQEEPTEQRRLDDVRAMSLAALNVYKEIRAKGTQRDVVATMQTRDQLYEFLGYHAFEEKLDELFREDSDDGR